MEVLGISTSPNKLRSQTLRLILAALDGAASLGAKTDYVDLCDLEVKYCTGCRSCFITGACFIKDDFEKLLERMLAADGMVWGSPNYSFCVPARMKAVIDRMADAIHCQLFDGKYSLCLATAGRDDRVITDYLKIVLMDFGSFVTGCAGAVVTKGPQAVEEAEKAAYGLGVRLVQDIAEKREYPDQRLLIDENRHSFQEKVRENASHWKHEFAYWEQHGWR